MNIRRDRARRWRRRTLTLAALMALPGFAAAAAEKGGYLLGPQDKLEIRVYDLRTGSGEAHQWAALNGEFLVDATGAVSLPLLGAVPASDGTPADLADAIAARLQAKIGLAQRPDASVQVIKYRPLYVIGDVDKPGEYEYRPGLSVLQAVGTAGGMLRARNGDLLGYERDALSQRGELRVLAADRLALTVRQARLDTEIADAEVIALPADVKARAADPDVARAVEEEQLLFDARRNALKSQIDSIKQAKALLSSELTSLAAKDATLGRQLDLTRKELSQISDLVSKGMAVVPRQLAAEQSAASFESSRLDVQLATLRAQQDLAKADRDMLDLRAKRRDEALTEATEVRAKLAADLEKLETARTLIYQAEVSAPLSIARDGTEQSPVYVLTRQNGGASNARTVTEGDLVQPGDVLKVLIPRRDDPIDGRSRVISSAAPGPSSPPGPQVAPARQTVPAPSAASTSPAAAGSLRGREASAAPVVAPLPR